MPPKRTVELVENMLKFARHYRDLSSWQRVKEKCILMHLFPNLLETEDTKPLSDFWANNFVKADSWVQRDFAPQTFTAAMRRALRADDTPAQAIVQVEAAHANEQLKLGDMHEELRLIVKQTKKKDIMISSAPNTQQGEVTALAVAPTAPADLARIYDDAAEQKAKRANNTQVRREVMSH